MQTPVHYDLNALTFIGCDSLCRSIWFWTQLSAHADIHIQERHRFKKNKKGFLSSDFGKLTFVVLGLVSYQFTMKLICCGLFFWIPYPSTRLRIWLTSGYGQSWNTPTPTGSQCWYVWFVLICMNVICCERNCMFCFVVFFMWQPHIWDFHTKWFHWF